MSEDGSDINKHVKFIAMVKPRVRRPLQTARYSGGNRGRGRGGSSAIHRPIQSRPSTYTANLQVSQNEENENLNPIDLTVNDSGTLNARVITLNQMLVNLRQQFDHIKRQALASLDLCSRALDNFEDLRRQYEEEDYSSESGSDEDSNEQSEEEEQQEQPVEE